jgi:hypothetical protein
LVQSIGTVGRFGTVDSKTFRFTADLGKSGFCTRADRASLISGNCNPRYMILPFRAFSGDTLARSAEGIWVKNQPKRAT